MLMKERLPAAAGYDSRWPTVASHRSTRDMLWTRGIVHRLAPSLFGSCAYPGAVMRRADARDRADRRPGRNGAHPLSARALAPTARLRTFTPCSAREPCAHLPSRSRYRVRPARAALAIPAVPEFACARQTGAVLPEAAGMPPMAPQA